MAAIRTLPVIFACGNNGLRDQVGDRVPIGAVVAVIEAGG